MINDKYQIKKKAHYVKLLLLRDELQYFDGVLSQAITNSESWSGKLRATRSVFVALNNVKDAANDKQIDGDEAFVSKTRNIRKKLAFANHFRNRGIGHLDDTLIQRAVQWNPHLFHANLKGNETLKIIEAQRAIIEACINSYTDQNGKQKYFDTEIDLNYPPDAKVFFVYLSEIVKDAIEWLADAENRVFETIDYHNDDRILEMSAVAAKTSFDLRNGTDLEYEPVESDTSFFNELKALQDAGMNPELLKILKDKYEKLRWNRKSED